MALFDFLRIALLPLDKWPYFFGTLTLNSRAVKFLMACQLYKVKSLRQHNLLENYECPCKQFSN
jgi:predicted metal-binding protein